jgi:hypothetical protein
MFYLTTMSQTLFAANKKVDECLIGKDLQGSGHRLMQINRTIFLEGLRKLRTMITRSRCCKAAPREQKPKLVAA